MKTYTIEGHIPGAADGVVVRLADLGYYPEEEYALAVSYADSFNGYARVVKSYRYTEV